MERSAHIVANLFAQVVCLLHLHTKSWNAMPVAAKPNSGLAMMGSPGNGGARNATNFAVMELPMTFRSQ